MSVEDETWDRPICAWCKRHIKYGEAEKHGLRKCVDKYGQRFTEVVEVEPKIYKVRKEFEETFEGLNKIDLEEFVEQSFIQCFEELSKNANETALSKGFDNTKTDDFTQICLMHSELGEATEALRKDLMDDHIPEFKGVEAELADCVIRIMNYGAAKKLRIAEAIIAKMKYNKTRPFRHGDKKV